MNDGMGRGSSHWGRLKLFGALVVTLSSVTLVAVVGSRLSDQALAVLAGAVCGVGAAIPTSLLIVAVSQRRRDETRVQPPAYPAQAPPVIVVTPQGARPAGEGWNSLPASLSAPVERQFTVVGGAPAGNETR